MKVNKSRIGSDCQMKNSKFCLKDLEFIKNVDVFGLKKYIKKCSNELKQKYNITHL